MSWLHVALELAREIVFTFDGDSLCIDYANPETCRAIGLAKGDLVGRPVISILGDLDLATLRAIAHLEEGASMTLTATLRGVRESQADLECRVVKTEREVRVVVIGRDRTTDRRLRRLEALWSLITRRDLSLEEQGRSVLGEGIRGLEVDGAALSHRDGEDQVADYSVGPSQVHPGYRVPFREALAALAQANGGYYACDDVSDASALAALAGTRAYAHRSFVTQTFYAGDRLWSVTFSAYAPRPRPFDNDDRAYVGLLADYFARHVERRDHNERMSHLAYHDALTGLPNRLQFLDRLDEALASAKRDQRFCAVVYLDFDGFKEVNDRFGHPIGDRVLFDAAHRVRKVLRRNELLGRLGGDEFAILLPILDSYLNIEQLRERVTAALSEPFAIDASSITLSASVGAAVYPRDGENREALLARADEEMYRIKHAAHAVKATPGST